MKDKISLKELYEIVTSTFPRISHNPEIFKQTILLVLKKDATRTFSTRGEIEEKGLEYEIFRQCPTNDFLDAAGLYLTNHGVRKKRVIEFSREYGWGKLFE